MQPSLPVSVQPAIDVPARQVEAPTQNTSVAMEDKLVEYISRLQAQGAHGHEIANPAALGSEVLSMLKGYLDRASRLQNLNGGKVNSMSESSALSLSEDQGGLQQAAFRPGPAEQFFEPVAPVLEHNGKVAPTTSSVDLDRAIELLSELLSFSVETSFISAATANISKSTTTLLHGQ